jgi:hypothetical protein
MDALRSLSISSPLSAAQVYFEALITKNSSLIRKIKEEFSEQEISIMNSVKLDDKNLFFFAQDLDDYRFLLNNFVKHGGDIQDDNVFFNTGRSRYNLDKLQIAVEIGFDCNRRLQNLALTPLYIAMIYRDFVLADFLIEHGAKIHAPLGDEAISVLMPKDISENSKSYQDVLVKAFSKTFDLPPRKRLFQEWVKFERNKKFFIFFLSKKVLSL